jgi:hypothetical protein
LFRHVSTDGQRHRAGHRKHGQYQMHMQSTQSHSVQHRIVTVNKVLPLWSCFWALSAVL